MAPPAADVLGLAALLAVLSLWCPTWLAGQRWPSRTPGTALAAWLAVLAAWLLAVAGIHLAVALAPLGRPLLPALVLGLPALARGDLVLPPSSLAAGAVGAGVLLWCLARGGTVLLRAELGRRAARRSVLLAATHDPEQGCHVLPVPTVTAFCVPGPSALVVVSQGFLDSVPAEQQVAVLAHERAHATGSWHLVPLLARAWSAMLPGLPGPARAVEATAALAEMLCDARAASIVGPRAMRRALGVMDAGPPDAGCRVLSRAGIVPVSGEPTSWRPASSTVSRLRRLTRLVHESRAAVAPGDGRRQRSAVPATVPRRAATAVTAGTLVASSLCLLVLPAVLMAR